MPTTGVLPDLRLTQTPEGPDQYRLKIVLEGEGLPTRRTTARFAFQLTPQDHEDLRWYFEDYPQSPFDPAPAIAGRVEARMAHLGKELFREVFQSSKEAEGLWAALRPHLEKTRAEVVTGWREAASVPWEVLRDPETDTPLALRLRALVRAQSPEQRRAQPPLSADGPVRILLVICRPGGADDPVPFRSVALHLIQGLWAGAGHSAFRLDMLRPPTLEQLQSTLLQAKKDRHPYHVVHFDGHGIYQDLDALYSRQPPRSKRGYLLFENPASQENSFPVHGALLGQTLVDAEVPLLVLNACRSAHAEALAEPGKSTAADDKARAFGTLAQEVMEAGVAGVVAMRYNVYVTTAAEFVAGLYAALAQGVTLGEAVTAGRRRLAEPRRREAGYPPRLQDWPVPVVYEAAPVAPFPERAADGAAATPGREALHPDLPPRPDPDSFGHNETLLALERAFGACRVVLLHGGAGSGKTATAAEFARWYALTGGVAGRVLFTSFGQHRPLADVLAQVGKVSGVQEALDVLGRVPVLWVWDNVEPVAGFPSGAASRWSAAERQDLVQFLCAAQEKGAKFLLTSRRDERGWLPGDLPVKRIAVPPMPAVERAAMARALARKHGQQSLPLADWWPLLQFTQGNPLAIRVLVGQALRDGPRTGPEVEALVGRLRAGEAASFADGPGDDRSASLGASLGYGFDAAFSEEERKRLALLHLFQGSVSALALAGMGEPTPDGCLPEVGGMAPAQWKPLLDRAAEIGLVTPRAEGSAFFTAHPALPWFLKPLFDRHYRTPQGPGPSALRAFVGAFARLGTACRVRCEDGDRAALRALAFEEANLLHACRLARAHGWLDEFVYAMEGLVTLYEETGRGPEWARLLDEVARDFAQPRAGDPAGEELWATVTVWRVIRAGKERRWEEAENLQGAVVDWARQRAAPVLPSPPPEGLTDRQRDRLITLAGMLLRVGEIQVEDRRPACKAAYEEALRLAERVGDNHLVAICAAHLGLMYMDVPTLRDLDQAEKCWKRSLELRGSGDTFGKAKCYGELGLVAWLRLKEARRAGQPEQRRGEGFRKAVEYHQQALAMTSGYASGDLSAVNHRLGCIWAEEGDLDAGRPHFRDAIRFAELDEDSYNAGGIRQDLAQYLYDQGRLSDALEYARAAQADYESFGDRALPKVQETRCLIALIERKIREQQGGP